MRFVTLLITLLLPFELVNARVLFSIHGSNTIGSKLAPQLAKSFLIEKFNVHNIRIINQRKTEEVVVRGFDKKTNLPLDIEIKAHGSSTGFISLENGDSQICMSSRPIKTSELNNLSHLGNLQSFESEVIIGLDGIAIITHKDNPLINIAREKLTTIFSGKIKYWNEISPIYKNTIYTNKKINIYSRDDNSGTYDTFRKLVLTKKHKLVSSAKRYESNAALSDHVSKDRFAIGFVSLPNIRKSKALAVSEGSGSARLPNKLTVATEDYTLSRRLFMYISEFERNADVLNFINYISTERGQENVDLAGYISQNIYSSNIDVPDFYPKEYLKLTGEAKRLSVNIHFIKGSLIPDNRAKRDLTRISQYIKSSNKNIKDIMLFGFSEDTEFKIFNISLSEARADYVELLLKKKGITINRIRGYGGVDQVAKNTQPEKNRRVEVWIR